MSILFIVVVMVTVFIYFNEIFSILQPPSQSSGTAGTTGFDIFNLGIFIIINFIY